MTIAEIYRKVSSYNRVREAQIREKATFDYSLANLIGLSVSRLLDSKNKYPPISDAYPSLFEPVPEERGHRVEIDMNKLFQFAEKANKRFENKDDEGRAINDTTRISSEDNW